jgi:hypothetical protein
MTKTIVRRAALALFSDIRVTGAAAEPQPLTLLRAKLEIRRVLFR